MRYLLYGLTLMIVLTGCHSSEEYLLGPSRADQVLKLTVSSQTAPADGISRVAITVQLDPRTDADKRVVTFTTTAGVLIAGGREGLSITAQADNEGTAVVELRSPIVPGTAELEVAVASVTRRASIVFLTLVREEIFDASVSHTSLPADGFSRAVITARLKRLGTIQQRVVTFETSAGMLIASGQESSRTVTVTADSTGKAEVELQSEKALVTARVRVTTLNVPHEFSIVFTPVDPAQVITLTTAKASVPADGVTPLVVSAAVAPGLPAGRRTVAFRSTLGQVIPSLVEADGSNTARSNVISTTTGTAHIIATVDGATSETAAQFTPALPDKVHVALDAAQLTAGALTTIRVTLLRSSGTVSPHLRMSYSAKTTAAASIGSFSAVTLAENGMATATYNVGTTSYLGTITIRASAEGGAAATATLEVVP